MLDVSYVIPSYNHEKYILNLLDSIKADSALLDKSIEIIIIDDGSTDNSVMVINQWMETNYSFPIKFFAQKNEGLAGVLNQLIELSQGNYIRLCASDDKIIPGSTAALLEKFLNQPDLRCVVGDGEVIDKENQVIHSSSIAYHGGNIHRLIKNETLVKELIEHWCVAGPSILIKKSHYQECLRYDEGSTIDDFDLFLSLLKFPNSIAFIRQTVCQYRIHLTNTSKTNDVKKRIKNLYCFQKIIEKYVVNHPNSRYLIPLKYKNSAKIDYLEKKYTMCFFNLCLYFIYKIKALYDVALS